MSNLSALRRWWAFFALAMATLAWCGAAQAQDASADQLIQVARNQAELVDQSRAAEAWDAASPTMKARVKRDAFAASTQASRAQLPPVAQRTWAGVMRVRYDKDADVPAGLYGNVDFSTRLTDGSTLFELVTLRQELDGQWRLMGYVPRRSQ